MPAHAHPYNGSYTGEHLARIAFPLGGIGAGMIGLEGTGALSHVSLRHRPDVFHEPRAFAALAIRGQSSLARVLEGPVPAWDTRDSHLFWRHVLASSKPTRGGGSGCGVRAGRPDPQTSSLLPRRHARHLARSRAIRRPKRATGLKVFRRNHLSPIRLRQSLSA